MIIAKPDPSKNNTTVSKSQILFGYEVVIELKQVIKYDSTYTHFFIRTR